MAESKSWSLKPLNNKITIISNEIKKLVKII